MVLRWVLQESSPIFILRNKTEAKRSISDASSMAPSEAPSEVEVHQRITSESTIKSIQGMVIEYCKNTSVHGLQYLGERKRPFIEKYLPNTLTPDKMFGLNLNILQTLLGDYDNFFAIFLRSVDLECVR